MKIGSTTGFMKSMVDILLEDAKKQGYVPDASVAGDEVSTMRNKKVLLRERKRHTDRGVSSTPSAVLSRGEPHPWPRRVPHHGVPPQS